MSELIQKISGYREGLVSGGNSANLDTKETLALALNDFYVNQIPLARRSGNIVRYSFLANRIKELHRTGGLDSAIDKLFKYGNSKEGHING